MSRFYKDQRGFTDSQDNQKYFEQKYINKDPGPYLATVKFTNDPERMGRLGVNIPALSGTTEPSPNQIIWCQYLSPFYGVKPLRSVSKTDPYNYKTSQTSYGMWAVPPDIDTTVMVIFAQGDTGRPSAFWMGCVQEPLTNQQIPGHAASRDTAMPAEGGDVTQSKQETYGTDILPTGEKNRQTEQEKLEQQKFPINERLADQLVDQGLILDQTRGTTTSSARRESPSAVFGISTPGRIDAESPPLNIGIEGRAVKVNREHGHSFVMDDGDVDGNNQLTRLRTASGHQLLMHDTEGVVYLANGSGKAFIEMDKDGTISVYSDGGINLRSGRDFNLHSDMNINFHAKGAINFTSETNLALNAEGYLFAMGEKGVFNSSQTGAISSYANGGITSYTKGQQLHGASGQFHLQGSQVHFNKPMGRPGSGGGTSIQDWGPTWLKADAVGIKVTNGLIDIDDDRPFRGPKSSGVDKFGNDIMERGLQVNKIPNKTTVSDFVTHEPYDRQSSTARKKKFIDEAMEEIKASSPELSATELKVIKAELLKQPSIKAVADKLSKVVNLNDKIKLPVTNLNNLVGKATEIQRLIEDPKAAAMNFIYGKIESIKNQALDAVKSFFRF